MKDNIVDIRDRVARHDLRYDVVPFTYFEGFIFGNGDLGAVLWFEEDRMVLSLDKADVWERRADQSLEPGMDYRTALQQVRDGSFDPNCRVFDPVRPPTEYGATSCRSAASNGSLGRRRPHWRAKLRSTRPLFRWNCNWSRGR